MDRNVEEHEHRQHWAMYKIRGCYYRLGIASSPFAFDRFSGDMRLPHKTFAGYTHERRRSDALSRNVNLSARHRERVLQTPLQGRRVYMPSDHDDLSALRGFLLATNILIKDLEYLSHPLQ